MTKIKNLIKDNPLYLLIIGILLFQFGVEIWCGLDNDFYHICFSGKQTIDNKWVLYENTSFILDGFKTINQQWLYSVIIYLSYTALGLTGVQLFTTIQFLVLCIVIYKLLMLYNVDKRTAVLIIAASMIIMSYVNCRPQMISLILIYAQLYITERYRQTGKTAILYLLPLLTLVQINVHSTFWIFHFIFILPYVVPFNTIVKMVFKKDTLIKDTVISVKPLIIPTVLMAVSLFINPYGIDAILCLFLASDLAYLEVTEMMQFGLFSIYAFYVVMGIVLAVVLYKQRKLTSTTLYIFTGTSLLYAMAIRNIIFYSIAVVFLFAELLKNINLNKFYDFVQGKKDGEATTKTQKQLIALMCGGIFILAAMTSIGVLTTRKELETGRDKPITPVSAVEYLRANEKDLSEIKLFAEVFSSSYFLHNGVGKVYMETKTEPLIEAINGKKDIINEYVFIEKYATKADIEAFLAEYNFDYLYIRYDLNALQLYLEMSEDYECVVTGETQALANGGYEVATYRLYKKVVNNDAQEN